MPEVTTEALRDSALGAVADARPAILPLEARGLVFEAGRERLIDGIDLTLEAGPVTVVMGPNGAGKSLLVRLLHGMIEPTAGTVHWNGRPLEPAIRERQAMVFQTPVLLRRSVAANIEFVLRLKGRAGAGRVAEVLEIAGLARHARTPARLLSGGERQRLSIARALATDPDVLFLDEPTVSLDPASELAIETIVRDAGRRGTKIVFITHDAGQAARLADEVVFVHRGRVLERGPAAAFFDTPETPQARDYLEGRIVL